MALGIPVGSAEYIAGLARARAKHEGLREQIPSVPHLQGTWLLPALRTQPCCNYQLRVLAANRNGGPRSLAQPEPLRAHPPGCPGESVTSPPGPGMQAQKNKTTAHRPPGVGAHPGLPPSGRWSLGGNGPALAGCGLVCGLYEGPALRLPVPSHESREPVAATPSLGAYTAGAQRASDNTSPSSGALGYASPASMGS